MNDQGAEKNNPESKAADLPGQGSAPGAAEKSKGGRPLGSKDKAPRRRPGERAGLLPPPGWAPLAQPAAAGGSSAAPAADKPAGNTEQYLWNPENSRPFAELPFHAAAVVTDWDGCTLNDREAIEISKPLARVLNRYFPGGSEYSDLSALCATLLVVAGVKRNAYGKFLKSQGPTT